MHLPSTAAARTNRSSAMRIEMHSVGNRTDAGAACAYAGGHVHGHVHDHVVHGN